jgi:hypothetical protein
MARTVFHAKQSDIRYGDRVTVLCRVGRNPAARTQCCHGCHSYYCNHNNFGDRSSEGLHCAGCWESCVR